MPQIVLSILAADLTCLVEQVAALAVGLGVHEGDHLANAALREIYALEG